MSEIETLPFIVRKPKFLHLNFAQAEITIAQLQATVIAQ